MKVFDLFIHGPIFIYGFGLNCAVVLLTVTLLTLVSGRLYPRVAI